MSFENSSGMKLTKIMTILAFGAVMVIMANSAHGATVRVSWNPNSEPDLDGYKVYYGTLSGTYTQVIDVGAVTSTDVSNLGEGHTYYFAVTAYDVDGNESGFSNEAFLLIPNSGSDEPSGDTPPITDIVDTDMDGIPDEIEDQWGMDALDPLDSLMDDDGDGVVNLVEYMAGTSPVDATEHPFSDNVLKDIIGELGETVDLSSVNPEGRFSIVPLTNAVPAPVNNAITPSAPGAYLYNVIDSDSSLVYRLRVSVTQQLTVIGAYEPGSFMELADQIFGIRIDIPGDAIVRAVPVGIGNVTPEALSAVEYGDALLFDVLPFGLVLSKPALITVHYEKENPVVQRYDSTSDTWVDVEDVTAADGEVTISTYELGTFRVLSDEAAGGGDTDTPVADDGGSGGGCFIQTAGF